MVVCATGSRDRRMGCLKHFGFQMVLSQVSNALDMEQEFLFFSAGFQPQFSPLEMEMFTLCFYVLGPCNLLFDIKGPHS